MTEQRVGRRWDPDELAALEYERDMLLRELRELDGQLATREISRAQHAVLVDELTDRAADAITRIERGRAARPAAPRRGWRTLAVATGVAIVVVVTAGVLRAQLAPRASGGGPPAAESTAEARAARLAAVVAERPDDVPARMAYARMLLQQQDLAGAFAQYDAASVHEPANAEALAYAGWIAVLTGRSAGGQQRLDRAVAADPAYPDAHALRGLALMRAGDNTAAASELRRYLELAPGGPLAAQVEAVITRLGGGAP